MDMSEKVEINVQPLLERIKWRVKEEFPVDDVRQFKGQGRKEGHVMLSFGITGQKMRLDIDIDIHEALVNDQYFEKIYDKIYYTWQAALANRQEKMRIN
jgi:hypothetical protein